MSVRSSSIFTRALLTGVQVVLASLAWRLVHRKLLVPKSTAHGVPVPTRARKYVSRAEGWALRDGCWVRSTGLPPLYMY